MIKPNIVINRDSVIIDDRTLSRPLSFSITAWFEFWEWARDGENVNSADIKSDLERDWEEKVSIAKVEGSEEGRAKAIEEMRDKLGEL
jgi:hypothetical protein